MFGTRMRNLVILLCVIGPLVGCQNHSGIDGTAIQRLDFLSDGERENLRLPRKAELTLATALDRERIRELGPEVGKAVAAYLKPQAFEIIAARLIDKHILVWIAFPDVLDGGVDLVYSVEGKRIVGTFLGGYRG
jgi:hypothetical protein